MVWCVVVCVINGSVNGLFDGGICAFLFQLSMAAACLAVLAQLSNCSREGGREEVGREIP